MNSGIIKSENLKSIDSRAIGFNLDNNQRRGS